MSSIGADGNPIGPDDPSPLQDGVVDVGGVLVPVGPLGFMPENLAQLIALADLDEPNIVATSALWHDIAEKLDRFEKFLNR